MSLDGFVADRNGRVDFALSGYRGPNLVASHIIDNVGAILCGRRTYDVGVSQGGGEAYGGEVRVPEFIVTRCEPPANHDPALRFLSGDDLPNVVAVAKEAAKGKMVIIIGPTLAASIMEAGLLDQIVIHVAPVFLGGGTRLFAREVAEPWRLEKVAVSEAGAITNFVLRPVMTGEGASGQRLLRKE
jgi:dihydrofolate reductase